MADLLKNICRPDVWEEAKECLESLITRLKDRRLAAAGAAVTTVLLLYACRRAWGKHEYYIPKGDALANYPSLWNHSNLMAKHLTPDLYVKLINRQTRNGFTLDQAIQTGVDNPRHAHICSVGIVAGDEESYQVFAELFDRIIEERHNGYKKTSVHVSDMVHTKLKHGKFDENFVISCRIRASRSLKGFRLPSSSSRRERRAIESILKNVLGTMKGDLEGHYYALSSLTAEDRSLLITEGTLFDKPSSPLFTSSGLSRDWPDARGIWYTKDKCFTVRVNEEDHIKIIAMETGGDMEKLFERFCLGLKEIEKCVEASGVSFMRNKHLGNITTCPSNLGTGLRVSALVRLPNLGKDAKFPAILTDLRLQKRGTEGSASPVKDSIFEISNADRLGRTEVELVQQVINGVSLLVQLEKRLQHDQPISDLMTYKL